MNNLLALDCTDRACSVAVRRGDRVHELFQQEQRTHARYLLGLIEAALQEVQLTAADLDAVLWCHGPGSFTGLRIAAACVQGLSFGLAIPALGFSSLYALALGVDRIAPQARRVWVGLDAHMGEIYCAALQRAGAGEPWTYLEEDRLVRIDGYRLPVGFDLYLGSALQRLDCSGIQGQMDMDRQVHAADLLALDDLLLAGGQQRWGAAIEPVYLRGADAWKKLDAEI